MTPLIIWTVKIFTLVPGLLVNLMGIYAIKRHKTKTNQTMVLENLSLTEIFSIVYALINNTIIMVFYRREYMYRATGIAELYDLILPKYYRQCDVVMFCMLAVEFNLTMTLISSGRLMCVMSPLKYKLYMKKSTVKKQIIISWVLSILLGIVGAVSSTKIIYAVGIAMFAVNIILSISTYAIIGCKVGVSNALFRNNETPPSQVKLFKKRFLVSGLIILSFIVFYATPWMVVISLIAPIRTEKDYIHLEIARTIINIGFIMDPLIYVYWTIHFRRIITAKFCCCLTSSRIETLSNSSAESKRNANIMYLTARKISGALPGEIYRVHRNAATSF